MAAYRFDYTADAGAGMPLAVVRASSAADVQATVRWAGEHGIPVVPRGAGSGLSGGSNAIDGCIVLSLERMRAVEIDPATRTAVVEAGALNVEVKQAAAEHGLWYPPDPSSFEICSIGGNVATNAGGLCCVKYGVTTDYVLGLDVVLADGTLVHLGGQRVKDTAGLSLVKLFVGSEGTLGVVTRATLRLVPAQAPPATLVATFDTVEDAARVVVAIGDTPARVDDGADGPGVDQRRRGPPQHGTRPRRRRDAARAVGRTRCRARRGDRRHGAAVLRGRGARVLHDDGAATRASCSSPPGGPRSSPSSGAARSCSRTSACPCRGSPTCSPASPRSRGARDVEIPVVAHAGDGNTHPIVVYPPATPARKPVRHRPSRRS